MTKPEFLTFAKEASLLSSGAGGSGSAGGLTEQTLNKTFLKVGHD